MAIRATRADGATRYLRTPGVYFEYIPSERAVVRRTGRPVFIGLPQEKSTATGVQVHRLSKWEDFNVTMGKPVQGSYLAPAVRGFFENGGDQCLVLTFPSDLWSKLVDDEARGYGSRLWEMEDVDLVCAPDLPDDPGERVERQRQILAHCERMRDRFAILDARPKVNVEEIINRRAELTSANGAMYFPWIQTRYAWPHVPRDPGDSVAWVPPCGHIAGVYARTDARVGVHKAPANEIVEGIVDLRVRVSDAEHGDLNESRVNCLRAMPGRGIRIWGARTLSGQAEWRYVNVRRLFITLRRWMESECRDLVFESNDLQLWDRISDRLNSYCYALYRSGALKGARPEEAYYVKCDAETNPPEQRDDGMVTTEVGLAATRPAEFIVVRITQQAASGSADATVTITERS